ncbi:response regulator transcription factor [Alcaligenes faecalis]|uniref:DNA-binding response regulator n=1 Tax=Alcaligenes faecalis TaxID=511 RepID=A0A2U2BI36_ALCFA|nr:response regulator transcription factor [Alcaligenes faecalis]ALO39278.1 two-component system response regulator [Alcaligenes faecalis]MBY6309739.1 response regulator transcription factor [Alcaligenes faecalis]MBY6318536.1 response regulator transcription factor [Alcaligenes faecalis]MBY6392618.1 response regulator transcription factor [Alcaligenes faecalis]PWE13684.1 DNA-binding response regulator [Alcaligenes faecalis]
MRILLIEDDPSLGSSLQSWLHLDGYAVDWLQRGDQVATALASHTYQCILLDRGLPGLDGDAVLRTLRGAGGSHAQVPVIVITARDTLADRVQGLDLGADDYLVKPFDLEELSARVRAALRRSAAQASPEWRHGPVAIDPTAKRVTLNDKPVPVTAREFAVLQALMHHPTHILSRAQLEEALYGWSEEVESNAIEVHIYNLRKKLGSDFIVTVRNQGYVLAPA